MLRVLALGAVLAIVVAATLSLWVFERLQPWEPGAPERLFRVEPGDSLVRVAKRLESEGLIQDHRVFEWLARFREQSGSLRKGEYRLSAGMSPAEILQHMVEGRVATFELVVPEGFSAAQIAVRLEEADIAPAGDFLAAAEDAALARSLGVPADRLEGYLFPDTYRFPHDLSGEEVARAMVGQFFRVWDELASAAGERGLSLHEVVTLASIVEKETGAPEERPLIASVFWNRLARRMRLESDPTTIYGIDAFDGNLRRVHLEDEANPYNTYRIAALPPGPIANPGRAALEAVIHPADSRYLYFVSRNDGTHVFSRSYAEHLRAVDRFQRRRASR